MSTHMSDGYSVEDSKSSYYLPRSERALRDTGDIGKVGPRDSLDRDCCCCCCGAARGRLPHDDGYVHVVLHGGGRDARPTTQRRQRGGAAQGS